MLSVQKVDPNADLSGGRAPLHYAADMGQTEVAEFLIAQGADVNVREFASVVAVIDDRIFMY